MLACKGKNLYLASGGNSNYRTTHSNENRKQLYFKIKKNIIRASVRWRTERQWHKRSK